MFGSKQIFLIARHIQCMTLRFHTLYNLALPRATCEIQEALKTLHLLTYLTHFVKGYHMPKNIKDKVLSIRITSQQNSKLSDIARELKISKSEIISSFIDNGTGNSESIKKKELDSAIITYFARSFSNINQIAKRLNIAYKTSGNIALEVILRAQEDLYKIQSVLTEILSLIRSNYDS